MGNVVNLRQDEEVKFYKSEIDSWLFKLYRLESELSEWNSDKREKRLQNRASAYDNLRDVICALQNKL